MNLFQANLTDDTVTKQKALRTNTDFCQQLIGDLSSTFEVTTESKRRSETSYEITVYPPRQHGRWGFGFTFEATDEGVSFIDQRGLWRDTLADILGVKAENSYETQQQNRDIFSKAVESLNGKIGFSPCRGCGDHYHINLTLNKDNKNLNDKIKLIIKVLMGHSVTTNF